MIVDGVAFLRPKVVKAYKQFRSFEFTVRAVREDDVDVEVYAHNAFSVTSELYDDSAGYAMRFRKNEIVGTVYTFARAALL